MPTISWVRSLLFSRCQSPVGLSPLIAVLIPVAAAKHAALSPSLPLLPSLPPTPFYTIRSANIDAILTVLFAAVSAPICDLSSLLTPPTLMVLALLLTTSLASSVTVLPVRNDAPLLSTLGTPHTLSPSLFPRCHSTLSSVTSLKFFMTTMLMPYKPHVVVPSMSSVHVFVRLLGITMMHTRRYMGAEKIEIRRTLHAMGCSK